MIAEEIRKSASERGIEVETGTSVNWKKLLAPLQNKDIGTSDTGWLAVGQLLSFSYGVSFPERMEFWDIQPLSFVLEIYKDGFLGANLHYINPDYRDAVAKSLINSGRGASVPRNNPTQISIFWYGQCISSS